jgi:hypothetical protein
MQWGPCLNTKCPEYHENLNWMDKAAEKIDGCAIIFRQKEHGKCIHVKSFKPDVDGFKEDPVGWMIKWLKNQPWLIKLKAVEAGIIPYVRRNSEETGLRYVLQ